MVQLYQSKTEFEVETAVGIFQYSPYALLGTSHNCFLPQFTAYTRNCSRYEYGPKRQLSSSDAIQSHGTWSIQLEFQFSSSYRFLRGNRSLRNRKMNMCCYFRAITKQSYQIPCFVTKIGKEKKKLWVLQKSEISLHHISKLRNQEDEMHRAY